MRKALAWRSLVAVALSGGALVAALTTPLVASGATAGKTSTARTSDWIVTIWVADTSAKAGVSIPATITIDNRSGHTVLTGGCPGTVYLMNLGNAKIPNSIIVPTPACQPKEMSPGPHVVRTKVWTFYEACSGSSGTSDLPRCPNNGKAPPLPAGTYRTNVVLPGIKGLPTPKPITVRLTAAVSLSRFREFPKVVRTSFGISFTRPSTAQAAHVVISPSQALAAARAAAGALPSNVKVTEWLGIFRNAFSGTGPFLAYAVILDGVTVPSFGPSSGVAGHELVVIVNARTGHVVNQFSYR